MITQVVELNKLSHFRQCEMLIHEVTQPSFIISYHINPVYNVQQDASQTTEQNPSSLVPGKPKKNPGK